MFTSRQTYSDAGLAVAAYIYFYTVQKHNET